jgi:hypothetical protein
MPNKMHNFPYVFQFALLALSFSVLTDHAAQASSFYWDVAGGVAEMKDIGSFYGPPTDAATTLGYNFNSSLFVNFSNGAPVEVQLGILQNFASGTGSTTGTAFSLLTIYPALRIQVTRLYFTVGYTPFVWQSGAPGSSGSGTLGYGRATGSTSLIGEAGLLCPITPEFSLGVAANAQFVDSPDGKGPGPVISASVLMRFHFGYSSSATSHGSNEFAGWRYPFGFMR